MPECHIAKEDIESKHGTAGWPKRIHPSLAKTFVSYLPIKPGQWILDPACGTGLISFLTASAAGPSGCVIGVDVSEGMLAQAIARKEREEALHPPALKHWTKYLKSGGIIALDMTHTMNLAFRKVAERAAGCMRVPIPYYRQWVKSEDSLRELLEGEGLIVLDIVRADNQRGYGKRYYDVSEADDVFDKNIDEEAARRLRASIKVQYKAKEIFREEWSKAAVDGKVEEVDTVFLGIARKDEQYISNVAFAGGCRCGGVECQTSSIKFIACSTLQTLGLSEVAGRTFYSACGTPISMTYKVKPRYTSSTMGSIDKDGARCKIPPVTLHIFLKERASWMVLLDDGAAR
ncbi:S-adenosyl-L-methionine-dependent methyltransferase [Cenococcum geophilum]